MKILAIITARGGSKGIKNKNIVDLYGKPLIQYTVEAAQKSQNIDKIILSSDDDDIIDTVRKLGVYTDYKRPDILATDTATTQDAIIDVLDWLQREESYIPEAILLLQPTSPLRSAEDIDKSIALFLTNKKSCLVGVNAMQEHPYECVKIEKNHWHYLAKDNNDPTRRQDYQNNFYYINGAIYIVETNFFLQNQTLIQENNTSFYVMPASRSVDIDEELDLQMASNLLNNES